MGVGATGRSIVRHLGGKFARAVQPGKGKAPRLQRVNVEPGQGLIPSPPLAGERKGPARKAGGKVRGLQA